MDYNLLKKLNITHVLNATVQLDNFHEDKKEMTYVGRASEAVRTKTKSEATFRIASSLRSSLVAQRAIIVFNSNSLNNILRYMKINIKDKESTDLTPWFGQTTRFLTDAVEANKNILIHCVAGASRSAAFLMCYMMSRGGHSLCLLDAFRWCKARRSCVMPNKVRSNDEERSDD